MADSADTTNPTAVRKCAVDDCDGDAYKRGFCNRHYYRVLTYGSPHIFKRLREPGRIGARCIVEGCERLVGPKSGRGMCGLHLKRSIVGVPLQKPLLISPRLKAQFIHQHLSYNGAECLIWPFKLGNKGYAPMRWMGRKTHAHRVICALVHGEPPFDGAEAAHSCGKGHLGCVAPNHLRWATRRENASDMRVHGTLGRNRTLRGDEVATAKFTNAEAIEIYNDPRPRKIIAAERGCCINAVWNIKNGVTYRVATGHPKRIR